MTSDDFKNATKNQHYISQTELSFFSISEPNYSNPKKVYDFKVLDLGESKLSPPKAKKIAKITCSNDLFTFAIDREQRELRYNMETAFRKYEDNYRASVENLRDVCFSLKMGSSNVGISAEEVFNIIFLKFLNIFRNPHSISLSRRMLDPIWRADIQTLSTPGNAKHFESIANMPEKECSYRAAQYGVSVFDFRNWLKVLFFILHQGEVFSDGDLLFRNHLEKFVFDLIVIPTTRINVYLVPSESQQRFIINDRGFLSDGDSAKGMDILNFSITRQMLMSVAVIDYHKFLDSVDEPDGFPRSEVLKLMERERKQNGKYSVNFETRYLPDEVIVNTNRKMTTYAARNVFGATRTPF